jgi:hypothetical protein
MVGGQTAPKWEPLSKTQAKSERTGAMVQVAEGLPDKPGMAAHASGPSYWEGGGSRITALGWPKQKQETLPEKQTKHKRSRWCSSGRALA